MHYEESLSTLSDRLSELDDEMSVNEVALRTAEMAGGRTIALQARKQLLAVRIAELRALEAAAARGELA
jgi:hypothetical protein